MKRISKINLIYLMPIMAIFLIAFSVGDKLCSLTYLLKIIPAFLLMIITLVYIVKGRKK